MSYPTIGGRLREEASGAGRAQAGFKSWGADPVKEIGQTCGLDVIVRRLATSGRSMVTAAKSVCSTWKIKPPGEGHGKTIYRHRSAPQSIHVLHSTGERAVVSDGMGAGRSGAVCEKAAARRRSGGGDHGQHQVVFRRRGATRCARGGGRYQSVSGHQPVGEEDGCQRRAAAGALSVKE